MNQADKTQQASHMNSNALNMIGGVSSGPAGVGMNMMRSNERATLNTYIYDYFLKYNMHDCAQAILREGEVSTTGNRRTSPSRAKRDAEGNVLNNGIDGPMDAGDQKQEDGDEPKQEFPQPNVPKDCPQGCFLYDWWCLFWDIFGARNGFKSNLAAAAYLANTQNAQRLRQEHLMFRTLNPQPGLLPGQVPSQAMNPSYLNPVLRQGMAPNGVMVGQDGAPGNMNQAQKELVRQAVMNNNNKRIPAQVAAALKNNQQMMQQANQRDQDVDMNGQQPRPQSPAGSQAANSPSAKRRNLGGGEYQELSQAARGQTPAGGPNSAQANQAHAILLQNGINPNSLTQQQFQAFQVQNPNAQQKSIQLYTQSLAQHARQQQNVLLQQQGNMPKMPGHVQQNSAAHAGSPTMHSTSEAGPMNMIPPEYYNNNPTNMRILGQAAGSGSHALHDYQMQLMVLEQQNKQRLNQARLQEQSRADHSGNQFQGMSPQGNRAAPSPQPPGDIKRGTPKPVPQAGPASPMPDGQIAGQPQRNSPAITGFNGQAGPEHQAVFYNHPMKEILGANGGALPNGTMMRPPTHPNFNGQMTPQMQEQVINSNLRQQQAGRGQPAGNVWQQQHGPMAQNAQQIIQQQTGPQQSQPQQSVSTPNQPRQGNLNHQNSMPPPSAPATQTNGRTQPSSPSINNQQPPTPTQGHKAAPKRKEKQDRKKKAPAPPVTAPNNVVTPSSEPPTPTTPITPQHPNSFAPTSNNLSVHKSNNFGAGQNQSANESQSGQQPTSQPPPSAAPPPPMTSTDMSANEFSGITAENAPFDFPDGSNDSLLDGFDFDSFVNNLDESGSTGIFDPSSFAFPDPVETSTTES